VNLQGPILLLLFSVADAGGIAGGGGAAVAPPAAAAPAPAAPAPAPARAAPLAETLARIDQLQQRRDDPAALAEARRLVDATVASAPRDYGALWRAARLYFWLGDDPAQSSAERSRLGKTGWDLAERAIAVNGSGVAGHYWAAVNIGNYALGLGVMKALTAGLEGKFKDRLGQAGKIGGVEHGSVDIAWGRFYEKLPWPKRDRKKSVEHLRRALATYPYNLRARVFLAETLANDDHPQEAKKLLDEVAAAPIGRYDAPEERRAKALATALMPAVMKQLK
jgi:hypothetical protein